jgi:hypothetical protein
MVKLHTSLPPVTWFLLAGAAAATAASILMAIACLYSRLSNARLDESLNERDPQGGVRYRPAALYWFGTIARVADVDPGCPSKRVRPNPVGATTSPRGTWCARPGTDLPDQVNWAWSAT